MNRTKIEWTDFTFNPVTGCWGPGGTAEKPNRCSYCYADRVSKRGLWKAKYGQAPLADPFAPIFHPDRLSQPAKVKKPSRIFVCSMADLFGDWVPDAWIRAVLNIAWQAAWWHTFQFLTKNPKRLKDFNPWPSNCWVGATVTNQEDDWRIHELLKADASVRFVSHEPLLSAIDMEIEWGQGVGDLAVDTSLGCSNIQWAIIGSMTGPGAVRSKPEWVQSLIDQYRAAGVPCFVKDSLYKDFPIREWPIIA